jgi:hypothetical protein
MRVNNDLYRICGIVDKKEFAWIPHTEHKLVDYIIEPPHYRLLVEVNGNIEEYVHPVNEGLDYLRNLINKRLNAKKQSRANVKIINSVS